MSKSYQWFSYKILFLIIGIRNGLYVYECIENIYKMNWLMVSCYSKKLISFRAFLSEEIWVCLYIFVYNIYNMWYVYMNSYIKKLKVLQYEL